MADISFGERVWVAQGVEQDLRADGRRRLDFRPFGLEADVVAQADGSARVHLGPTDVLAGVKVELGAPDAAAPDRGRVQVTVEASSAASPEFRGRSGEDWGLELARALEQALAGAPAGGDGGGAAGGLDLQRLCILPGKAAWVVHVDALVLNDGGNVLDALGVAVRAALAMVRVPSVDVTMGDDPDDEPEIELTGEGGAPLDVSGAPVVVTVSQVGARAVVDLSAEEEPCASAALRVAVNAAGRILGVSKAGAGGLDPSLALEMLEVAQKLGPGLIARLDRHLHALQQQQQQQQGEDGA